MYIAVCDDQAEEREEIEALLRLWQEERRATLRYRTFCSAAEMLDAAEKEAFTLYLLDVMMPGTNGLVAAREIRGFDNSADIVFLTSSTSFAYESYGVHAMDYILKPVQAERLFLILDQLFLREQKPQEGLTLKSGSILLRVLFSQLTYVEVYGKHLYFNLTDGTVHEIYGTLHEYEEQLLSRPEFMRVHRSYIVNMLQAAEFSSAGIRTFTGKTVPVSRLLYPQLQKEYMKLLFTR